MVREYHKWYSERLQREMELLVYGYAGARILLFPTRTGRYYDYENWNIIQSLHHLIENGYIQIYALDSIDQESFYCFWAHPAGRLERHIQYENYILNEVIPLTREKNGNPSLMSVGCSMGAFHAVNIALRHPHLFSKVVGLSGRYDLTTQLGMFDNLLNGYFDDTVHYLMPTRYVPYMPEGEQLNRIRQLNITLACGRDDAFHSNNHEFSNTLWKKDIKHNFFEWDGMAHKAKYWQQMLPIYI
jgi:esterase/lipase superfamily enzyme